MADHEYSDALPQGPVRGRGAGLNPGNRFVGRDPGGAGPVRLHVLGEHLDRVHAKRASDGHARGVQVATRALADETRRLINRVDSPDLPFHWTINPYRGCEHGCVYCYARPTHEMLGLSCGLDFETTIMVKRDAPALLERELGHPRWRGEPIMMSGVTDPYQPMERSSRVTRGCLEIMARCGQPVAIVTKSSLVTRDVDCLASLASRRAATAAISITTLDADLARRLEPRASAPRDRLRTIRTLADGGIPVMVMVAPIIPGLTDHETPAILAAAAEAGATAASWVLLRLPHQVEALFVDWLRRHAPLRAERVLGAVRATREGRLSDAAFGSRMRGRGVAADHLAHAFDVFSARHGLRRSLSPLSSSAFRRPAADGQMGLFEDA